MLLSDNDASLANYTLLRFKLGVYVIDIVDTSVCSIFVKNVGYKCQVVG